MKKQNPIRGAIRGAEEEKKKRRSHKNKQKEEK